MTERERMEVITALSNICQQCLKGIDSAKRLDGTSTVKTLKTIGGECDRLTRLIETAD